MAEFKEWTSALGFCRTQVLKDFNGRLIPVCLNVVILGLAGTGDGELMDSPSPLVGRDALQPVKQWASSLPDRYLPEIPVQRVTDALQSMRDLLVGRDDDLRG